MNLRQPSQANGAAIIAVSSHNSKSNGIRDESAIQAVSEH
jgi:hypothetical protein